MENEIGPIFIEVDGKKVEIYARYEKEEEGFIISANSQDGTGTEIYIGFDPETKTVLFDGYSEKGKEVQNFSAEFPVEGKEEKTYAVSPEDREKIIALINYYAILQNMKANDNEEYKVNPSRIEKIEEAILKALSQLFDTFDNTEIYDCISDVTNILESEEETASKPEIRITVSDDETLLIESIKERRLRQFAESIEAYIETLRRKVNTEKVANSFLREAEKHREEGKDTDIELEVAQSGFQIAKKLEEEARIIGKEEVLRWIQEFIKGKKITEIKHLLSDPKEISKEDLDERDDEEEYPGDDEYDGDEYGD